MSRIKVGYDREENILKLAKAENVKESVRIDNVILDLDNDYRIVGVEILYLLTHRTCIGPKNTCRI